MAKKASVTYRDLMAQIKKGVFTPIYILMGDEPYYIDKVVEALENNVVDESDRDFNFTTLYGADTPIDGVIAAAQQLPMMADRQIVILKEAQSMQFAKRNLDKLAGYVEHPNEKCVLVIAYKSEETLSATSKLMKAAAASDKCVIFKSAKLRDYQLDMPIKDYCREKGVGIDDDAAALLGEFVGTSLDSLYGAIDKIILSQNGKSKRITANDINTNITRTKDYSSFDFVNALSARNYFRSMMILNYFRQNQKSTPTVMLSAALFNFFSKVCVAHLTKDKSDANLMNVTGLKTTFALRELKKAMRNFNTSQSIKIIAEIRNFDCMTKGIGSMQNEYDLLKELCFKIFTA